MMMESDTYDIVAPGSAVIWFVTNTATLYSERSENIMIQTLGNPPVLGPRPVKTVEDPWKPLLCRSSSPVKNSCREPLYGDSYAEKIILGPVKVLEDQ